MSNMIFYVIALCLVCSIDVNCSKLKVLHEWKYLDFTWENAQQKDEAIKSGYYNASSSSPFDVDEAPDGRIFVMIVRVKGVPATLTTISNKSGEGGRLLKPYPNWSWHLDKNCGGITSIFRVTIVCNHLWVIDCGNDGQSQVCPAQLLVFDLSTDKLVKRVVIPRKYAMNATGTGLLVTPVVDLIDGTCRDPFNVNVYMADSDGYGMVIWDGKDLFRLESEYFRPESRATHFDIAGQSFDLADGLVGMAITPDQNIEDRVMYFRPLCSFYMANIKITDLNCGKYDPSTITYHREDRELRSQSIAQAFSSSGVLFYSSVGTESMICWNRCKPFDDDNNVQFMIDEERLQYAAGVKIVRKGRRDESLMVVTNRFQRVLNNGMDISEVNIRILKGTVRNIVKGTNCE